MSGVVLLTKEPSTYDSKALCAAVESANHECTIVDYRDAKAAIRTIGSIMPVAIIARHTPEYIQNVVDIISFSERMGIKVSASSQAIKTASDKLATANFLLQNGIPTPKTLALGEYSAKQLVGILGDKFIVKPINGSQGKDVHLYDSTVRNDLNIINDSSLLAQEYIAESQGEDVRAIVVGKNVIASMKRIAAKGDIRSNLHAGGKAVRVEMSSFEQKIAKDIAGLFDAEFFSIDFLRGDKATFILELNTSPGLKGIEAITGVDVASEVVQSLLIDS